MSDQIEQVVITTTTTTTTTEVPPIELSQLQQLILERKQVRCYVSNASNHDALEGKHEALIVGFDHQGYWDAQNQNWFFAVAV